LGQKQPFVSEAIRTKKQPFISEAIRTKKQPFVSEASCVKKTRVFKTLLGKVSQYILYVNTFIIKV
jgi:hypothetical protein